MNVDLDDPHGGRRRLRFADGTIEWVKVPMSGGMPPPFWMHREYLSVCVDPVLSEGAPMPDMPVQVRERRFRLIVPHRYSDYEECP